MAGVGVEHAAQPLGGLVDVLVGGVLLAALEHQVLEEVGHAVLLGALVAGARRRRPGAPSARACPAARCGAAASRSGGRCSCSGAPFACHPRAPGRAVRPWWRRPPVARLRWNRLQMTRPPNASPAAPAGWRSCSSRSRCCCSASGWADARKTCPGSCARFAGSSQQKVVVQEAMKRIARDYYRPISEAQLSNSSVAGMVAGLHDRFSHYLTPSELREFDLPPHFAGIGVRSRRHAPRPGDRARVRRLPGGARRPAERAGDRGRQRASAAGALP